METRKRGVRKAKEKSTEQSTELATKKPSKATKNRIPLKDMPINNNVTDFNLHECSVRLEKLSPIVESSKRRHSDAENVYDFEESPSQEEIVAPNDEINEVIKKLQMKNIAKVAKRKPKIEKQTIAKTTVKAKPEPKKRKAAPTTKPSAKKKKIHNLSAIDVDAQHKIGGNDTVTDNNDADNCSVQSVCSDIIDQHGETIGLIEKEWAKKETRSLRSRIAKDDDVTTSSIAKVNNNKVKVNDTIETIVEQRFESPIEFPNIPDDSWDDPEPNPLPEPMPLLQSESEETTDTVETELPMPTSRTLRRAANNKPGQSISSPSRESKKTVPLLTQNVTQRVKRGMGLGAKNKPNQSTPKASRPNLNATDFFKNASPLKRNESIEVAPKIPLSSPDHDVDADPVESFSNTEMDNRENVTSHFEKSKLRVYGRSPLKNMSNASATNNSSSTLFDQQKESFDSHESIPYSPVNLFSALPKSAVHVSDRQITETSAPALTELFGFDEDINDIDQSDETAVAAVCDKNALEEKRKSMKRFLKNSEPKMPTLGSPKKRQTPVKAKKREVIFAEPSNVQKDIRSALHSHKNPKPVADAPNLFSDTETERSQDRRKSYTRNPKQYRRLVADSEHETDEEDNEPEEIIKKPKKSKAKSRKKAEDSKQTSADNEELEKYTKEFNSMCEEVEQFEVPIVRE